MNETSGFTQSGDNSNSVNDQTSAMMFEVTNPCRMRPIFPAPRFCETKVADESPIVRSGMFVSENIFRAEMCPAMTNVPNPFIADCRITLPEFTIEPMQAIESPCPKSSL